MIPCQRRQRSDLPEGKRRRQPADTKYSDMAQDEATRNPLHLSAIYPKIEN